MAPFPLRLCQIGQRILPCHLSAIEAQRGTVGRKGRNEAQRGGKNRARYALCCASMAEGQDGSASEQNEGIDGEDVALMLGLG
ncbi:hypothetical protein [Aeromonas sobria]|uniref:hypothetical protein n=1 Tax=Aeromonas sobria TaxID=646 RepID=UPI000C6E21A3|nr:hypothetical protein [Aeromonas sobria]PKQ78416.1 hypothetical protein CJF47_05990 [Aeromonas sobria]